MDELKRELHDCHILINQIDETQKKTELAHKDDLEKMGECVKNCQIEIGQHHERLKAFEDTSKRQNGTLEKVSNNMDSLNHELNKLYTKLDELGSSLLAKITELERNAVINNAKREKAVLLSDAKRDELISDLESSSLQRETKLSSAISELKTYFDEKLVIMQAETREIQASHLSKFQWKVITAIATFAFLLLVVIITIETHTFGGLP